MKEELRIDIVGLAGACSYALDCIEAELVKIKNKHGKRVAYISVCMAEYLAIQGDALQDLAMCALLHDNALTQYITEELERNYVIDIKKDLSVRKTNLHCIYGEKNITKLPFKTDVSNVILYHHEHADGTGPFQKKWNETPLPARIIHLADTVDIIGNSIKSDDNRWDFICQYLSQKKDSLFDSECVNAFLHVFTKESFMCLSDDSFETKLWEIIPREKMVFDWEMCKNVADFFAKIVDYKSSFTSRHSIGVAEKASLLAKYMGYDSITVQKMYLAGALHDIGKMAVGNEILEKPDKLTDEEFAIMRTHAEKGGEIIPKITGVDKDARGMLIGEKVKFITHCPECGSKLVRYEGEAAHYCPNETACPPQIKGKIEHFISRKAMNIDGLGPETVDTFYRLGLIKDTADLYQLTAEDIKNLDRMGEKSAENIIKGIKASKEVPFER